MEHIDYILPVYFDKAEGPYIHGNGFFIDNLFITAAHVPEKDAASIGIPYIYWKGEKLLLNDTSHLFTSYNVDEEKPESFESDVAADLAVFSFSNITSPLTLSQELPNVGMRLSCNFHHSTAPTSIEDDKDCYLWETIGVVDDYVSNVSNFFIAKMTPSHPNGGSSGCPLFSDGKVYGILHSGCDNMCAFYSAAHAVQLLDQLHL